MRNEFLPFALPSIDQAEINEVADTLRSDWITTGPKTHEFARIFADKCETAYAVPVNSCTAALHLSLVAAGIGPGDEVITSPMTFCSTANVIVHTGATPVFADIDPETMNIDPLEIELRLSDRTKAIMPVHYAGQPCEMDKIMSIASQHGVRVIEDAAHAPFAAYRGKVLGGIGDATCFSFYATKNITTAEGGMLTTNDEQLYKTASTLSLHGLSDHAWDRYGESGSWYYQVHLAGFKYNMFDIQAAMGLKQLEKFDALQGRRDAIAAAYNTAFLGHPALTAPRARGNVRHVWHLYPLRLRTGILDIERAAFIDELRVRNIGASVHFIPVHLHPFYQERYGFKAGDYPVAEGAYEGEVSLPIYPRMSDADVQDVIDAVLDICEKHQA